MSYRYFISITYTEMGQLNTYNPYIVLKNVIEMTSSMLNSPQQDTL